MQAIKNYNKEQLTIDIVWANIFALLLLIPILLLFGLPYFLLYNTATSIPELMDEIASIGTIIGGVYILAAMLIGIVLHELIHGLIWAKFAKNGFKSIKFGVMWKMLCPYCHCKEALSVRQYIIGGIAPAIILGIIPAIIAIAIGNLSILFFGMYFITAGAGDFLIIDLIRKEKSNTLVQDHPTEGGCYVYREI
jgi:hypothetical protein